MLLRRGDVSTEVRGQSGYMDPNEDLSLMNFVSLTSLCSLVFCVHCLFDGALFSNVEGSRGHNCYIHKLIIHRLYTFIMSFHYFSALLGLVIFQLLFVSPFGSIRQWFMVMVQ